MDVHNIVVIRGTITSPPVIRDLPSGVTVTNLEVTSRSESLTASVPVVFDGAMATVGQGDEVIVVGHVRRRFFRSGGSTQSRTEVVASAVVPGRQRKRVERSIATAVAILTSTPVTTV